MRLLACLLLVVLSMTGRADAKTLVVFDNDFAGPGGADIQPLAILLGAPAIDLLGCTVVTGDAWVREETAYTLRFLEIAGRSDVPVAVGAQWPLVNTPSRMAIWEKLFGRIPWKGAWNGPEMGSGFHPEDPDRIPAWPEGLPHTKPRDEDAAHFLIRMVHAHPHEVVVLAAGPMTNVALAVRLDPDFAASAKALVFMGGLVDANLAQVTGNADFNSDFNFLFDPEAAHIVLTAPWPRIVGVGNVSNGVMMTKALVDRLASSGSPAAAYLARHALPDLPLWDEMAAAIVVDPGLVTRSVTARMDVDIAWGPDYGRAHVWPEALAPHQGEQKVELVQQVATARMVDLFVKTVTGLGR